MSFSYSSFVKFHGKKIGNHNMTVLYLNLCYKEAYYKGTILYNSFREFVFHYSFCTVIAYSDYVKGSNLDVNHSNLNKLKGYRPSMVLINYTKIASNLTNEC